MFSRLHIFDCGQTIEVMNKEGVKLVRMTVECGDGDCPTEVALYLIDKGFLSMKDFEARDSARTNSGE
jgi:hypothetical protein